ARTVEMAVQAIVSEETDRLWTRILSSVQERIGSPLTFETWFRPMVPRMLGPDLVDLEVPNAFFVDWIHEHHLPLLRECLSPEFGRAPAIRLAARDLDARPATAPPPALPDLATRAVERSRPRPARGWLDSQLNPRHTFETFIVGSSNRFTHAACMAVAGN